MPVAAATVNAFSLMKRAQGQKVWPTLRRLFRPNMRFKLHNDLIMWLTNLNLGWSLDIKELGVKFVDVVADILWYLDPHRSTLSQQGCGFSSYWDRFQGYNIPAAHFHMPKQLSGDDLLTKS
jgi:hypothetical protein